MKGQVRQSSQRRRPVTSERGVTVLEMLIMVAMVMIISGYALTRISGSQQYMRMENASREFMSYVEKARLDSMRRHAGPPGPLPQQTMASVSITGPRTYTVVMDFDGDGNMDAPRNITIPPDQGVVFNTGTTPLPINIAFNWRGRTVSTAAPAVVATYVTPPAFSLQTTGAYDIVRTTAINLSTSGDASITEGNRNVAQPRPVSVDTSVNASTSIRNDNMRVTGY
ncbi:MAG TPA: type II secretion system protein [Pyrinomonadaceae bacterium]|jgi:Tfp pilus assembly protein FimT|nr:type II secretion system protein [Pyrinomonadaceae bacterium]